MRRGGAVCVFVCLCVCECVCVGGWVVEGGRWASSFSGGGAGSVASCSPTGVEHGTPCPAEHSPCPPRPPPCLAPPLPPRRKVSKAYFSLLEVLCHGHTATIAATDAATFNYTLTSLEQAREGGARGLLSQSLRRKGHEVREGGSGRSQAEFCVYPPAMALRGKGGAGLRGRAVCRPRPQPRCGPAPPSHPLCPRRASSLWTWSCRAPAPLR